MSAITDLNVWRLAQEIIALHPEEPEFAACQRADTAWEAGNMATFRLWMRVAKAVAELVKTRPHVRAAIN